MRCDNTKNEIFTKQAWGKDALEFNPDRFNEANHHAYQETFIHACSA